MYTQITRAQEQLYCVGLKSSFTHDYILNPVPRRCTFLSCMYNDTICAVQNSKIKRLAQHRIPYFIRESVWNRDAGRNSSKGYCYVCAREVDIRKWHCAHLIATAMGGEMSAENMVISCEFCNCSAGTRNFTEFKEEYQDNVRKHDAVREDVLALIKENINFGTNTVNKK